MKLSVAICFILLAMMVQLKSGNEDENYYFFEYFTLKLPNGEEIKGDLDDWGKILSSEIKDIDDPKYKEIYRKGDLKFKEAMEKLKEQGASRLEMSLAASNIFADMYEELFAAAGMELKLHNRHPIFLA